MEDREIIELYWSRSERAILETAGKYGPYCSAVAYNILRSPEDSEECVSDTWLKAWDCMPPQRPNLLKSFLGKICRNLALNRWRYLTAEKRGGGQMELVLDELEGCVPGKKAGASGMYGGTIAADPGAQIAERMTVVEVLNRFLAGLPVENRVIFVRRYWYLDSIQDIAKSFALSESKVKMSLLRSRNALRSMLEKEGIWL